MLQITNQEAHRLHEALKLLDAYVPGKGPAICQDILAKLKIGAVVWDCQQRAAGDLNQDHYNLCDDVFEWIELETSAEEAVLLMAWLAAHVQGASETGQLTINRFTGLG